MSGEPKLARCNWSGEERKVHEVRATSVQRGTLGSVALVECAQPCACCTLYCTPPLTAAVCVIPGY